jgi:hypothetical protein
MLGFRFVTGQCDRHRARIGLLSTLVALFVTVTATDAGASMRIQNHLDPAGDPTLIPYHFAPVGDPADFTLPSGGEQVYGGPAGQYTAQALPPAGWVVADIQCIGPRDDFVVDVPHGVVTINRINPNVDEQTCSFTVHKLSPSAPPPQPGTGVAPAPPAKDLPKILPFPERPTLTQIDVRRRFVSAIVRLPRRAVVRGQLLWRGTSVVGSTRLSLKPGTYTITVPVLAQRRRQFRRLGLKHVTLTLRFVVVDPAGKSRVLSSRVLYTV